MKRHFRRGNELTIEGMTNDAIHSDVSWSRIIIIIFPSCALGYQEFYSLPWVFSPLSASVGGVLSSAPAGVVGYRTELPEPYH